MPAADIPAWAQRKGKGNDSGLHFVPGAFSQLAPDSGPWNASVRARARSTPPPQKNQLSSNCWGLASITTDSKDDPWRVTATTAGKNLHGQRQGGSACQLTGAHAAWVATGVFLGSSATPSLPTPNLRLELMPLESPASNTRCLYLAKRQETVHLAPT